MAQGTLYYCVEKGEPLRTRAILPVSLIKYFNLDVELGEPDEHFPSEFPARLVPSYRSASGRILAESIPVALMLSEMVPKEKGLLGDGSPADIARITAWLNQLNIELMNNIAAQFTMIIGRVPYDKAKYDLAGSTMDKQVSVLEDHLKKNTFLVGERISVADLYGITMLLRALQHLWGPEYRAKIPSVIRWYNTVKCSPIFNGFFDSVEFTSVSKKPSN